MQLHQASPARRVLLGQGAIRELAAEVSRGGGSRVVLVTSATLRAQTTLVDQVVADLEGHHLATFSEVGEHTPLSAVTQLQDLLEQTSADCVVSFGGGSVIDGVKAAIHQRGTPGILHVAVPTTLSGAEFTPTAGVTEDETRLKRGVRDPAAAPAIVLLDPEVTLATPERLWLSSGIRALDHAVETQWAPEGDPLAGLLVRAAIQKLLAALPRCRRDPDDLGARYDAQLGAWWAATGLAGSTMGPSHQLGRLLGATFQVPHGITSCVFLPATLEWQLDHAPSLVGLLGEPFGVQTPEEVVSTCRQFIAGLGLPTNLAGAGLDQGAVVRFLEMAPPEWHPIVKRANQS